MRPTPTIALLLAAAAVGALQVVRGFADPWTRDLMQDLVMGEAIRAGLDPYADLTGLLATLHPDRARPWFDHASPHPPPTLLWALPLSVLPPLAAQVAWLGVELAALGWLVRRGLAEAGLDNRGAPLAAGLLAALAWAPVSSDVAFGQTSLPLAVALVWGMDRLAEERSWEGGVAWGIAFAMKPLIWPLFLLLLLQRRLRAVLIAATAWWAVNLATWPMLGVSSWWRFYAEIGPSVERIYRGYELNLSASAFVWRFLAGAGSTRVGIHAPAVWEAPALAEPAAMMALLGVGLAAAGAGWMARESKDAAARAMCLAVFAAPVTWTHYFVLLIVPFATVFARLAAAGWPRPATTLAGAAVLLAAVPHDAIHVAILAVAGADGPDDLLVPPWAAFASFLPALGPLLMLAIWPEPPTSPPQLPRLPTAR